MEKENVILTDEQLQDIAGGTQNFNPCGKYGDPVKCSKISICKWIPGNGCEKK